VRQVGKTSTVTSFGRDSFPEFLRVDLERDSRAAGVFRSTRNPKEIVEQLRLLTGVHLSHQGLLFIDEIQAAPQALTALKYFAEDMPELAVIAAGSHLGILLASLPGTESYSFPVGQVEFLELSPVNFEEFAQFMGQGDAVALATRSVAEGVAVPEAVHALLWDLWKKYLVVGGLPQVVVEFAEQSPASLLAGFSAARHRQENLLTAYEADIAKHSGKVNAQHIIRVLHALPGKLSARSHEGTTRFTFKDVVPGIRGHERLAGALDWLTSSGIALRVPQVRMPIPPLKGFSDEHLFKLFLFDVGLFGALSGIDPGQIAQFNFGMYKGTFAESFVLQELRAYSSSRPIVGWSTTGAEVEFVIEHASGAVPIEVKSSHKFASRSLASFEKRFNPGRSYLLSANPGARQGKRHEVPVYLAGWVARQD
jgi:predicted AAA+ superfamily ATPase